MTRGGKPGHDLETIVRKWLGIVLLICCAGQSLAGSPEPLDSAASFSIRWASDPRQTNEFVIEVSGASADVLKKLREPGWSIAKWQALLAVYADQGDLLANLQLPPMLGTYQADAELIRFKPQFALETGVSYRSVFHPSQLPGEHRGGDKPVTSLFQLPTIPIEPSTAVSQVYPTADILPENLLKFYVHFTAPMRRGNIYDHIHLRNESGKPIELPFLEIGEELWDPGMVRLTLFIDPGRIKRGVKPLEEIGPALEAGKRYTLAIDQAWKDAKGNPLKADFQKSFTVTAPDRNPIDPAEWRIYPPKQRTVEPLQISFPKPLDHALAQRMILVTDASGARLPGETQLQNQEREWRFAPTRPWPPGRYYAVVQTTLEDLAGNNIGKQFEVDLFETVQQQFTNSTVKLPIEIR